MTSNRRLKSQAPAVAVARPGVRETNELTMGAKGQGTRARLMRVVGELLETNTVASLRVAEIAAAAGTSPAAFYRYFADAAEAALAVVQTYTQSTEALLRLVADDWPAAEAMGRARVFVDTYIDTWEEHAAILRMRNLAAEAGDARFGAARERAVRPLQDALAQRFMRAKQDHRISQELNPSAAAGALIALLERIAAVSRTASAQAEITHDTLAYATAYILSAALPTRP